MYGRPIWQSQPAEKGVLEATIETEGSSQLACVCSRGYVLYVRVFEDRGEGPWTTSLLLN